MASSNCDRVNNSFRCVMGRSHQLWDELLKWWGQRTPLIGTWRGNNHLTGAWNICQQPTISYHWITLSLYWASDWPMQLCCYIQQFFIVVGIVVWKNATLSLAKQAGKAKQKSARAVVLITTSWAVSCRSLGVNLWWKLERNHLRECWEDRVYARYTSVSIHKCLSVHLLNKGF